MASGKSMAQHSRMIGKAVVLAVFTLVQPANVTAVPPPASTLEAVTAELLSITGEGFRVRKTDHFAIVYDTSYETLRPLVGRLEGIHDAIRSFCEENKLVDEAILDPLGVILFDRFDDFAGYAAAVGVDARAVAGFYHHPTNISAFCNVANTPGLRTIVDRIEQTRSRLKRSNQDPSGSPASRQRRRNLQRQLSALEGQRDGAVKTFNRFVIQHEAAHQIFFNLGVHVRGADNPTWLVEGLACQFEVPQPGRKGRWRRINQMRLSDFREALGVPRDGHDVPKDSYDRAIAAGRFTPLADLISRRELFALSDSNVVFRYAEAWALVFYLNRRHRESFAAYLRLLGRRRVGEAVGHRQALDEFQSAFGKLEDGFERDWITDILKLRFDPHSAGR